MKHSFIYLFFMLLSMYNCKEQRSLKKLPTFENIDLVISAYNKNNTIIAFEIDSIGRVLEVIKSKNKMDFFSYYLNRRELDSLNKFFINEVWKESYEKKEDCAHGIYYNMTVLTKDEDTQYANLVCNKKTRIDEAVFYIWTISETKSKQPLFNNFNKYIKFIEDYPK